MKALLYALLGLYVLYWIVAAVAVAVGALVLVWVCLEILRVLFE